MPVAEYLAGCRCGQTYPVEELADELLQGTKGRSETERGQLFAESLIELAAAGIITVSVTPMRSEFRGF